jgi:hypothetical protein
MKLGNVLALCAAATMAAAPLAAQAAPTDLRTSRTAEGEQLAGSTLWIALAAVALAVGIYLIVDDGGDEDLPTSP